MKKIVIAAGIVAATAMSGSSAMAFDGTVKFTGEIVDQACTVNIGTDNTLTVDMGKVSKTAFTGVGTDASTTKFTIKLKDCPAAVTSAKVKFDGAPDASDSSLLALDSASDAAKGVAIKLMTVDKEALPLHSVNDYSYKLSSTEENNLDFYAAYRSTSATVTAGKANSVANFTVNYN
ncbi:fimbrial protein [Cronobacter turicensis]